MPERPRRSRARRRRGFEIVAALLLAAGCEEQREVAQSAPPPPAVGVVEVARSDVRPTHEFVGRIEAMDTVDLRARVTGVLEQRLFEEGADVAADDLLFIIEKDLYAAEVAGRQAELASAEASKANTAAQLQRGEELVANGNIPASEVDLRRADDLMAAAAIEEAQAALEQARINLGYTEIRAPIAGRIGRAQVSVGNLVGPESGVLATIVSQNPIYVTFPVSQRQLLEYRRERGDAGGDPVIRVTLPDDTLYAHLGEIDFLDVQVDPGTDTVTARAELPNPERLLVDGQFVGVRVEAGEPQELLAVPQAALQVDQAGPFVLVVGSDDTVEARRVTLGDSADTQAVVRDGLREGERVIVEGIQKVRPGMVVAASETAPAPAGQAGAQAPAGAER